MEGGSEQSNEVGRESLLDCALRMVYNGRAGEDELAVGLRLVLGMVRWVFFYVPLHFTRILLTV